MNQRKEKIYGFTSAELYPLRGKVKWKNGRMGRYERYINKALEQIAIPEDTAIVLTDEKRYAYDMSEIAPAEENGEDFFVIFVHEFSVAEIEHSIERVDEFFPEFRNVGKDERKKYVVAFIQKVLLHELGHRRDWIERGLFAGRKAEVRGELRDNEEEAEDYAWREIEKMYGAEFAERLRKVAF